MKHLLVSLLFVLTFGSYAQAQHDMPEPAVIAQADSLPFTNLTVDQMASMIGGKHVIVLDVRTPAETAHGTIEGAVIINALEPGFGDRLEALNKDKTYLVYCRSGRRSANACTLMAEKGFKHLYNLQDGIVAWREAGKRVVVSEN